MSFELLARPVVLTACSVIESWDQWAGVRPSRHLRCPTPSTRRTQPGSRGCCSARHDEALVSSRQPPCSPSERSVPEPHRGAVAVVPENVQRGGIEQEMLAGFRWKPDPPRHQNTKRHDRLLPSVKSQRRCRGAEPRRPCRRRPTATAGSPACPRRAARCTACARSACCGSLAWRMPPWRAAGARDR
jgi:hypothetical protein